MTARWRKFIGSLGILVFLLFYVGAVGAGAQHLPESKLIEFVYFVAAGLLWGLPIIPLITWMNRGR